MEKNIKTAIVYWGNIGIMEKLGSTALRAFNIFVGS